MSVFCCGKKRNADSFEIKPNDGYISCVLHILHECPNCRHYVLELERVDAKFMKTRIRKINSAALKLYDKLESSIIKKITSLKVTYKNVRTACLNYSEYGTIKKCYSNFSSMKLGKNKPNIDESDSEFLNR